MSFIPSFGATLGLVAVAPVALFVNLIAVAPASAQTSAQFTDVQANNWAASYIQTLAERGVVSGFPDGSFRPNEPVTRAQYAAMVRNAFPLAANRSYQPFRDVSSSFWASPAIAAAYSTGFLSGYPDNEFRPGENIPRVQVLVSLANGLGYQPSSPIAESLALCQDASSIPSYATNSIAAATDQNLVVNYPSVGLLNPNRSATRAEVAAFIYQALSNQSQVAILGSPYVARLGSNPVANTPIANAPVIIPAGTSLALGYDTAEKIYLAPNEPNPVPITLITTQVIQTQDGRILVPLGSEVMGTLRSDDNGAQFFADQLKLASGETYALDGTSQIVTNKEVIREGASVGRILRDTALGAGAAAVISGVTGDRKIEATEVLGGAGAGAIFGALNGRSKNELFVIDPATDLTLTLNSPVTVQ